MPGVLMIESLAQAAAILLFDREQEPARSRRASCAASTKRSSGGRWCPATRVRLEVTLKGERSKLARVRGAGLSSASTSSPRWTCCSR